jgi:hypothetical protein
MNTYEVRTQDGQGLCGIVTDGTVKAVRNLSRGLVSVWDEADVAMGYATVGVDPTLEGPLVLVVLDAEGREVHRAEVDEYGVVPPEVVTRDRAPIDLPAPVEKGPDFDPGKPPVVGAPTLPPRPTPVRPNRS